MNKYQRIYFSVLVLFIAATFFDVQITLADNKNNLTDQRLAIQSERLEELKKIISERKKQIEESFALNVQRIQTREAVYLRQWDQLTDKFPFCRQVVMSELIEGYTDLMQTDTRLLSDRYFSTENKISSDYKNIGYKSIPVLQKPLSRHCLGLEMTAFNYVKDMERFREELIKLEKSRDASLTQLAKWEKSQQETISETIHYIAESTKKQDFGMIQGINYEKVNPFIMINDQIVYQGQSIGDIEVIRIEPTNVEFKKKGKSWVQAIDETANDYWKESVALTM